METLLISLQSFELSYHENMDNLIDSIISQVSI